MENQLTPAPTMSVKDWVITLLISFIPIVGFILLFVWAFSASENPNKSNWAKAMLIWIGIGIVIWILIMILFGAFFMALFSGAGRPT